MRYFVVILCMVLAGCVSAIDCNKVKGSGPMPVNVCSKQDPIKYNWQPMQWRLVQQYDGSLLVVESGPDPESVADKKPPINTKNIKAPSGAFLLDQ